jgi:hypothetical protein
MRRHASAQFFRTTSEAIAVIIGFIGKKGYKFTLTLSCKFNLAPAFISTLYKVLLLACMSGVYPCYIEGRKGDAKKRRVFMLFPGKPTASFPSYLLTSESAKLGSAPAFNNIVTISILRYRVASPNVVYKD